ncbi:MAG: hypothetical protein U0905_05660 [Pirellulales bacterium]
MKFRLKSLLLAMTLTVAWCALARLHLGWALFGLICTPVILLTVSITKSHRFRIAKIAVMIPCLAVVYVASMPPAITMARLFVNAGYIHEEDANNALLVCYRPLSLLNPVSNILGPPLQRYFELWFPEMKSVTQDIGSGPQVVTKHKRL